MGRLRKYPTHIFCTDIFGLTCMSLNEHVSNDTVRIARFTPSSVTQLLSISSRVCNLGISRPTRTAWHRSGTHTSLAIVASLNRLRTLEVRYSSVDRSIVSPTEARHRPAVHQQLPDVICTADIRHQLSKTLEADVAQRHSRDIAIKRQNSFGEVTSVLDMPPTSGQRHCSSGRKIIFKCYVQNSFWYR